MSKLFELKIQLVATRPRSWDIHLRYARLVGGQEITLAAGTWLLEQEPARVEAEEAVEYLYRLPTGETVALARPLSKAEAEAVADPQAITAMAAFRTLEQAAFEDWGVQMAYVDRLPPFALIKCPLCGGTEFTSLDFASVWCNRCNARYQSRYTAGDPGFVVDCSWEHYHYGPARYLLPRSPSLGLYLVLKNSADPREMSHPNGTWAEQPGCTPEQPRLTGDDLGLRPGLHACNIGDWYDWSLSGWAPTHVEYDHTDSTIWQIDGELWPGCAYVLISDLNYDERQTLELLAHTLQPISDPALPVDWEKNAAQLLINLIGRHSRKPIIAHRASLPPQSELAEDERYLLYRWLVYVEPDYHDPVAYPVWYVVKPIPGPAQLCGRPIEAWEVMRRDICPACTQRVRPEELAVHVEATNQGHSFDSEPCRRLPHGSCRKVWELGRWRPYLEALLAAPPTSVQEAGDAR
ncbi:MAG: hypothetical protein DPW09_03075 [Anaerolineae bacterium]|nr:hypothetical protein [Anaerolineae bacterium]